MCELIDGALVITGRFEEQDVATAERTDPGRRVVLTEDGGIEVHPAGPPQGIWAELGARD
jgi:hypothetical protein